MGCSKCDDLSIRPLSSLTCPVSSLRGVSHVSSHAEAFWHADPCLCIAHVSLHCLVSSTHVLQTKGTCVRGMQVYMCANEWQDVKYTRVPSVCMKNNKGSFEEHDKQRFTQYLEDVQAGKKSIASGALKPHELVGEAM